MWTKCKQRSIFDAKEEICHQAWFSASDVLVWRNRDTFENFKGIGSLSISFGSDCKVKIYLSFRFSLPSVQNQIILSISSFAEWRRCAWRAKLGPKDWKALLGPACLNIYNSASLVNPLYAFPLPKKFLDIALCCIIFDYTGLLGIEWKTTAVVVKSRFAGFNNEPED